MPHTRDSTLRLRKALFTEASRILESEYATGLNLTVVAHRIATSRRQLQRAFQEVGNTTFREQLTRVRIERAVNLLQQSNMTVRQVASEVGYRYPGQFARIFHRYLGLAPSVYRGFSNRVGEVARSFPQQQSSEDFAKIERKRNIS